MDTDEIPAPTENKPQEDTVLESQTENLDLQTEEAGPVSPNHGLSPMADVEEQNLTESVNDTGGNEEPAADIDDAETVLTQKDDVEGEQPPKASSPQMKPIEVSVSTIARASSTEMAEETDVVDNKEKRKTPDQYAEPAKGNINGISENDDVSTKLDVDSPDSNPLIRVVKFPLQTGPKEITVHIINENLKKPYLGGFRNRLTGQEYHNASAQTFPKLRCPPSTERFHRDTQTVATNCKRQQTFNDTSTQMTKTGCYVSDVTDKILIPGKYVTADEVAAHRLEKVIILQTYWRRWLAVQYVKKLRADKIQRIEWEKAELSRKEKEKDERVAREYRQRVNPHTKEDFDLLYSALEKWRLEEIEKINHTRTGAERKAALAMLLEQEAYLIQSIERHKLDARNANKVDSLRKFLDKAALPKKWRSNYDGKYTEMDTPDTLRAQQLRDLYNSLQMSYLTTDERLDILLTLKQVVKEHDCKLTQEIVELIDRETDLLTRGVKNDRLNGLRQRIITLFLQYCKTPLFNPEIASQLKVPQDPSSIRKNIFFCPSCNAYLPSSEFSTASNSRIIGRCIKCSKIDNDARLRQDFSKFRNMLRNLRQDEENYNDDSKMAFFIQDADFHYLVENIWNGQSCLSAWDDLHDLVILRWNRNEEWTPWNCILLTKDEASAHLKLGNVNEAYGRIFIGKVHHRHVVAKTHFTKLNNMTRKEAVTNKSAGEISI